MCFTSPTRMARWQPACSIPARLRYPNLSAISPTTPLRCANERFRFHRARLEQGHWPAAGDRTALAQRCRVDARLHESGSPGANAAKWKSDLLQPQQATPVDQGRELGTFPLVEIAACRL